MLLHRNRALAAALDDEVTSETSPPDANDRTLETDAIAQGPGVGPRAGWVPARGSRIVTTASEVGSVERTRVGNVRQDKNQPRAAPCPPKAGAMREAYGDGRLKPGGKPSADLGAFGHRRRELTGDERVMTPRPCVIEVCIVGA